MTLTDASYERELRKSQDHNLMIYSYLKYDTFTVLKKMQRSEQTSERVLNRRYMKRGLFCQRICEGVTLSRCRAPARHRIKLCRVPPGHSLPRRRSYRFVTRSCPTNVC